MRIARLAVLTVLALTVTGCGATADERAGATASESVSTSSAPAESSPAESSAAQDIPTPTVEPQPAPAPAPAPDPLAGKTVVIDPGHNGANAANPAKINAQVPDGNGGTKACNTTGTSTNAGYPEHEFTWQVATAVRDLLTAKGITVVMTRQDDAGVGPCVNERAQIGNDAAADAVVSLHGDGAAASARGFFCILTPLAPGGPDIAAASAKLAQSVTTAIAATAVMPTANYEGADGIDSKRSDLAGLNLSTRPTTMCELGNMRSAADSAVQTSESGRATLAAGIADGIAAFLAS